MTSTAVLVAAYLAKGGRVITAKTKKKRERRERPAEGSVPQRARGAVQVYKDAFLALYDAHRGVQGTMEDWAAREIQAHDPHRDLAEAAALAVIARDEGVESARLYKKELCRREVTA